MSKDTINFKELREKLSSEDVKRILLNQGVQAVKETDEYIIYPTVCHNISGGSPKLYYYKDSRLFKCYTQCEGLFDIFELLIKMSGLVGRKINIFQAIEMCGLSYYAINETEQDTIIKDTTEYFYNLLHSKVVAANLPELDINILKRFTFDMRALKVWQQEGISYNSMLKYGIRFDPINNCIVIPNFDINDKLISIRGRYFEGDIKYRPISYNGQILSHPSSMALYGLNINKDAISRHGKVVVFEGEKSVLKMDTIYGDENFSIATLGKTISNQQIQMLVKLGVKEVILAYDADYTNYDEMDKKRNEYIKLAKPLTTFFNVCLMIDMDMNLLDYKDSPIDKGKDVFEKIYKNRLYVC